MLELRFTGDFLSHDGARAGFVLLAGFLATFLFIRTSARLMRSPKVPWWPGSVTTEGGLHIHHLVFGIIVMLLSGFLSFSLQPDDPWFDVLAGLFGIGMGLTLDEFALWLHLEDVYWSEEGRQSADAVVVAALVGGLVLCGVAPFDADGAEGSVAAIAIFVAACLVVSLIAILKGKLILGIISVFVVPVGVLAAIRLAKPASPWARRRYPPGSAKLARATKRHARQEAWRRAVLDRVAGAPSTEHP